MTDASEITKLLNAAGDDADAQRRLLEAVYREMHAMAQGKMRGERAGHTLQATALVSEAYLRLMGGHAATWQDRKHFFRVAAECMRRILIDHARGRHSLKRGAGRRVEGVDVLEVAGSTETEPERLLALNEALKRLEGEDPRAAEIVKLRYFAGLSVEETADLLELSARSVKREWAFARARLHQMLADEPAAETEGRA